MLLGRRALVTGAGRGLGRAIALRLAADGAGVAAVDTDAGGAGETARQVQELAPGLPVVADCATADGLRSAFDAAFRAFGGPVDLLVNNAGVLGGGGVLEVAEDDVERVLRVNAMGPMLAIREFGRGLVAAGSPGAVVNITSTTAHVASLPGLGVYAASKAALLAYTRAAATDLARHRIRVNAVAPGWMRTHDGRARTGRRRGGVAVAGPDPHAARRRPGGGGDGGGLVALGRRGLRHRNHARRRRRVDGLLTGPTGREGRGAVPGPGDQRGATGSCPHRGGR